MTREATSLDKYRKKVSASKRAAILNAAKNHFEDGGYEGAGVAQIADDADVSTATLYKHFTSKQALFWHTLEDVATREGSPASVVFLFKSCLQIPDHADVPSPTALEAMEVVAETIHHLESGQVSTVEAA